MWFKKNNNVLLIIPRKVVWIYFSLFQQALYSDYLKQSVADHDLWPWCCLATSFFPSNVIGIRTIWTAAQQNEQNDKWLCAQRRRSSAWTSDVLNDGVFAGGTGHFVGFVELWLVSCFISFGLFVWEKLCQCCGELETYINLCSSMCLSGNLVVRWKA